MVTYDAGRGTGSRRAGDEILWPWLLLAFLVLVALGSTVSLLAGWVTVEFG